MHHIALGEGQYGISKERIYGAQNHDEAVKFLNNEVSRGAPLTPALIKELHFDLWRDTETVTGGSYRNINKTEQVCEGMVRLHTEPEKIPGEVLQLCEWVNHAYTDTTAKTLHPIVVAAIAHYNFHRIQPFHAGNGRCGRLVLNYVLTRASYLPAVIRFRRQQQYHEALMCANNGDIAPLVIFLTEEMSYADYVYTFFTTDVAENK